jgi:hypothetical protein
MTGTATEFPSQTITSTFLHPALNANDENQDLKRIRFFQATDFALTSK